MCSCLDKELLKSFFGLSKREYKQIKCGLNCVIIQAQRHVHDGQGQKEEGA